MNKEVETLIKKYERECVGFEYCHKHCCYGDGDGCPKCRINFPIHLRDRYEVMKHSTQWEAFKILGWLK